MNNNKKILFFDIDGTLITDDGSRTLPKSTVDAIVKTREAGNLTFINTGRPYCNVDQFIRDIPMDGYVCGCGSYIRYHDEVIFHKELEPAIGRELAYKARELGFIGLFEYSDYTCYDEEVESPLREELVNYFAETGKKLVTKIEDPEFRFDKFYGWFGDESKRQEFIDYIQPYFDFIDRGNHAMEAEPSGHSKATGIDFLLEKLDIPKENAYVFGDGNNDLEMMREVTNSICMKDGSKAALETATYVTDTVLGDGIAKAMSHFQLI